jgi:hypothetical protein
MPLESIREENPSPSRARERGGSMKKLNPFNSKLRGIVEAVESQIDAYKKDEKIANFLEVNTDSVDSSQLFSSN